MKNFVLIASLILAPLAGFAQGAGSQTQSERMHQTEAGRFELIPLVAILTAHYEFKTNPSANSANSYGLGFGTKVEYGLSEMFSLGADFRYADLRTTYNTKTNVTIDDRYNRGLSDPKIYLLGRSPTQSGWVRYGLNVGIPFEKRKTDGKTSNFGGSGLMITPFVGFENLLGPGYIGGRLAYDIYRADRDSEDTSSTPSVTSKTKDGQQLDLEVFYEWIINPFIDVGFVVGYQDAASTKSESNGVTTSNDDASALLQTGVYVPMHFSETIALIPSVYFGNYTRAPGNTIDKITTFEVGTAARFTF